jgi:ribosomal protein S12 methylthiotransferase
MESLVAEAKNLAKKGVKELILIAQELTYYGLDIYKKRSLNELIEALSQVEGIEWIRLHYAYPAQFPLDIIDTIAHNPKVCNYLDIPLQHASDRLLKDMKRNITKQETIDLIHSIRAKNPNIAIRTSVIVGFPTETEEDFQELIDFITEMKFDRLGVFVYSHEEDTSAYKYEDAVPEDVKMERQIYLMELQSGISYELNQDKIGKTYNVLVDRKEKDHYIGRTEFDSPEVDNEVIISANDYLRVGDFVQVKIVEANEFDLIGELVK